MVVDPVKTPDMKNLSGAAADRSIKRHELTHWLRFKKGKMKHVGKPTIRGVATTVREEFAAHRGQMSRLPKTVPWHRKVLGIVAGTKASTQAAYPKGILKTLLTRGKR